MHTVKLNGANAKKVAEAMGGVLILWDLTADEAMIAGGDPTKVELL